MPPYCTPEHFNRHSRDDYSVCPSCGWCSANPWDRIHGWCGHCKAQTALTEFEGAQLLAWFNPDHEEVP